MRGASPYWRSGDRVLIRVRASPGASRDAVEGLMATADGPAIKVRVRAIAEDGAANAAIAATLAAWIGCAKTSVALTAGGKSRVKTFALDGQADELAERLARLIAA